MKLDVYNIKGEKQEPISIADGLLDLKVNKTLVAQAVRVQLANRRHTIANTKTRGMVSGGGKKPWRQKGTGNARAGSSRSPIWRGGGITFGPLSKDNFSLKMPQKMRRLALLMTLSDKAINNNMLTLSAPKELVRKDFTEFMNKQSISDKTVLVITSPSQVTLRRTVRNLANVSVIGINALNVVDIAKAQKIVWSKASLTEFIKNYR